MLSKHSDRPSHQFQTFPQHPRHHDLKSRTASLIALTVVPAVIVGALLWWAGSAVSECTNEVLGAEASPDDTRALVLLVRDCGADGLSTQGVVVPAGGELETDAAGFLALDGRHELAARWDAYGNVEVTLPAGATVLQQRDEAAGTSIIYN